MIGKDNSKYVSRNARIDDSYYLIKKLALTMLNSSDYQCDGNSTEWIYQEYSITATLLRQPFLNCTWDSDSNNFEAIATHSSQYLFCDVKTLIPFPF